MPRPRKLEDRVLFPVNLERRQIQALRVIAQRRKTSMADIIREAIEMHIRDQVVALGIQTVFDDNYIHNSNLQVGPQGSGTKLEEDPLTAFKKVVALQELQKFERALQRDIEAWEQLKPRVVGGYGHRVLPSDFFDLRKRVEDDEKRFRRILREHLRDLRDRAVTEYAGRIASRLLQLRGELSGVVG